jgi:hypothetical protein
MFCRLCAAGLALFLIAFIARIIFDGNDPDAQARQIFRRNLTAASSNWNSVELECSSPGCANHVEACWTEAGVKYVFSGFRQPKSIGGGIVSVSLAKSYRAGGSPALVTYCFMSNGSPTKVIVGEGTEADMGWAESRAREFFYATPANDGQNDPKMTN